MEPRAVRLEAPNSVQAVLDGYNPATDSWSFSFDSPFWKAVKHAHSRGRRGQGVRVAVIDTGCDLRYPRLRKLVDRGVQSFVPGPESEEVQKHGTAVALLISKVAPDCRLDVYRVFTEENRSDPFATLDALGAAGKSAAVINLSLGETKDLRPGTREENLNPWDDPESLKRRFYPEEPPCPLCQAAAKAVADGAIVFASVGNSIAHVYCPARMDGVVAVGFRSPMTVSEGKEISIEMRSRDESTCADLSVREVPGVLGSSFACPLYAGAAALGVTQQEMTNYISAIQRSAFPTHYHSLIDTGNGWKDEEGVREIERRYLLAMEKIPHVHCAWQARLRPDLPQSDPEDCVFCGLFAENLYTLFGLWLGQTDRHDEAREILEVARAIAPWSAHAWALLGDVYRVLGDLPQAIRHCEQAVLLQPGRPAHESALANLLELARQWDATRSTLGNLRRALDEARRRGDDDRTEQCLTALTELAFEAGERKEMLNYSRQLVEIARRSGSPSALAQALARFGLAQEYLEDYEAARRALEEASGRVEHLDPEAQLHVDEATGRVLLRLRHVAEGLPLLEAVIDVRMSRGDYDMAADIVLRAGRQLLDIDKSLAAGWLERWQDLCDTAAPESTTKRAVLLGISRAHLGDDRGMSQ